MTTPLPPFEGSDVTSAALRVTNAGDGLSEALDLEPSSYHVGQKVWLVLEATVTQVNHKPTKAGSLKLQRVHTASALRAAPIAQHQAEPYLNAEQERVANLRASEADREMQLGQGDEDPGPDGPGD